MNIIVKEKGNKVYYVFPKISDEYFNYIRYKMKRYIKLSKNQFNIKVSGMIIPIYCAKCHKFLNLSETSLEFVHGALRLVCIYCGTLLERV